jgi:hypothetical protein
MRALAMFAAPGGYEALAVNMTNQALAEPSLRASFCAFSASSVA